MKTSRFDLLRRGKDIARKGWTNSYLRDLIDTLFPEKVHTPVTIAETSAALASINEDQELEILITNGEDGREVELTVSAGYVVWRYVGELTWNNLVSLAALTGPQGPAGANGQDGAPGTAGEDGIPVEISVQAGWVCWRYVGGSAWTQLYQVPAADNSVEIYIDFSDTTPFVFTAPYAMKFTSQTAENGAATIAPALNTNLAQYQDVTITPAAAGLVTLTGEKL